MTEKARRGFKAMDPEAQRNIASKGGTAAHKYGVAHRYSSEEAGRAGRVGGAVVASDRDHMADIGRKGARSSSTRAQIVRTQKHTPEDRIAVEWATAKLSKIEAKNHRALADLLGLSEDHLARITKGALVPARPLLALFHVLSIQPELKQALEAFWSDYEAAIQVPPPALESPTVSDG